VHSIVGDYGLGMAQRRADGCQIDACGNHKPRVMPEIVQLDVWEVGDVTQASKELFLSSSKVAPR
jgi:hypothetical protein